MKTENKPENPPAFVQPITDAFTFRRDPSEKSMTMRDHFAGLAMQGWLASFSPMAFHPTYSKEHAESIARASYAMADSMLKERAK